MEAIKNQLIFLLGSFLSGFGVMLAYEVVNVLCRLFHFRIVGRLLLDVFYFAVAGICVFRMVFLCNQGTLRSFFVVAFAIGAILYRKTFGERISEWCVRVIRKAVRVLSGPVRFFRKKSQKRIKKK